MKKILTLLVLAVLFTSCSDATVEEIDVVDDTAVVNQGTTVELTAEEDQLIQDLISEED
jgi:PBP1b-binding outer membrane lipoprotein LpoB